MWGESDERARGRGGSFVIVIYFSLFINHRNRRGAFWRQQLHLELAMRVREKMATKKTATKAAVKSTKGAIRRSRL